MLDETKRNGQDTYAMPYLLDHVALWMPLFVWEVVVFHELLKDGLIAARAVRFGQQRKVVAAVHLPFELETWIAALVPGAVWAA